MTSQKSRLWLKPRYCFADVVVGFRPCRIYTKPCLQVGARARFHRFREAGDVWLSCGRLGMENGLNIFTRKRCVGA